MQVELTDEQINRIVIEELTQLRKSVKQDIQTAKDRLLDLKDFELEDYNNDLILFLYVDRILRYYADTELYEKLINELS